MNNSPTHKIIIRPLELADAKRIYEINRDALGYDFPLDKTKSRLEDILCKDSNMLFAAECDSRVVGYIHAADYDCSYTVSLKNLLALAVDTDYQGMGIGRQLIERVLQWAKQSGSEGVRLVSGSNRTHAHGFYEHCGFTLRKVQKNYIMYL